MNTVDRLLPYHGKPQESRNTTFRPGHVLVVDDEPNVRLVFRTTLESSGYRVDEAADGLDAVAKLKESCFDIVLLDLLMPVIGGMETLKLLRDRNIDVPVVMITAHGSIPDAVEAMKLGAVDFLSKPLTPEALRHVVRDMIERHRPKSEATAPASRETSGTTIVTLTPTVIDLSPIKRALNQRDFDTAARLLEEALDIAPDSAEANTLMGLLHESRGEDHAAYQCYKKSLTINPQYSHARDNMRRYCERFALDFTNKAINPAVET